MGEGGGTTVGGGHRSSRDQRGSGGVGVGRLGVGIGIAGIEALQEAISPLGVGVVIEAKHMCMMARGVQKQSSKVTTSEMLGTFRSDRPTREEFLNLLALERNV